MAAVESSLLVNVKPDDAESIHTASLLLCDTGKRNRERVAKQPVTPRREQGIREHKQVITNDQNNNLICCVF
jgi:hypothetical protein